MFKFNLGDQVELNISGEKGVIIGRADYAYSGQQYFVSYADGNGCAQDKWFYAEQLTKIN